ncbi:type II toxin-antitoxin system RatA family toxin [Polymorphobacter sp.]|uniref:type II toxin-antitoxin system RatA family toxin n=1 Tax=Polymorphobacter sp. TaxID=1909290 RepID=UPI003F71199E
MPKHSETRFLPFSASQMFDLVADIDRYPEFLPWVQALRVKARDGEVVTADMIVGFKMVRERFTSRVTLVRPDRITVNYISGPLKYLQNDWTFRDVAGGCEIDFLVDFEFQNKMFERLAGMFFGEALRRMVGAFETRAKVLYGASAPGISKSSATSAA